MYLHILYGFTYFVWFILLLFCMGFVVFCCYFVVILLFLNGVSFDDLVRAIGCCGFSHVESGWRNLENFFGESIEKNLEHQHQYLIQWDFMVI